MQLSTKSILAGLLMLLMAAPCLAEDFTVEMHGVVQANAGNTRGPAKNLVLTAVPDPLWGHKTESDLDHARRKLKEDFPAITVSGSGTTDANGEFRFNVTITVPDGKQLPKSNDGQNPPSWFDYAVINIECDLDGYRPPDNRVFLYIGRDNHKQHIYLNQIGVVTGRLLSLSNMKPLADTTVIIRPKTVIGRMNVELPSWKIKSDAKGNFELNDKEGPIGQVEIALEDGQYAFASNSKAWQPLSVTYGKNDLGNLMVVPGCTVKLRVIDSIEKKPISIFVSLKSGPQALISEPVPTGVIERSGIPEGTYLLEIITGAYFGTKIENTKLVGGVNDLGDIVLEPKLNITIELEVDQGQVPPRASASASLIEGTPPADNTKRGKFNVYNGSANGPRGFISGLHQGRWHVEVIADQWAPYWTEVTLPMEGNLKVKLTQGGSFDVTVTSPDGTPSRIAWIGIAVPGTGGEKWLRERNRSFDVDSYDRPPGLFYPRENIQAPNPNTPSTFKPGPLAPGKYLLRARADVGLVETEFEIKAGQHLPLKLSPKPGRIEVTVTREGKPASGEKLAFLYTDFFGRGQDTVIEGQTDSSGRYTHEADKPATYYVLLKREKDWVDGAVGDQQKRERLQSLGDRRFQVELGTVIEVSIDSGGRERTWLTIELDLDKGWTALNVALYARFPRSRQGGANAQGIRDGDKYMFGMLRPGNYWLKASLQGDSGGMVQAVTEIRADAKSEQTVKVKLDVNDVTVTVKLPKGVPTDRTVVSIFSTTDVPQIVRFYAQSANGKKGKYTVSGVPPGEYDVVVTASSADGRSMLYGSERVKVSGSTKCKVTINDDQGALRLSVSGGSQGMLPNGMADLVRVTLLDKNNNPVSIGYPPSSVGPSGGMTVQGIPAGNYTVLVEGGGCLPWKGEVAIKAGSAQNLNANLVPAALARLSLNPGFAPEILSEDFTLKLEDAQGNPLQDLSLEDQFLELTDQGGATLYLAGLDSKIKRIRIKLKNTKELVLDVNLTDGATVDEELKFEKQ